MCSFTIRSAEMTSVDEYTFEVIDNEDDARVCATLLAEEFVAHNSMALFSQFTSQFLFEEDTWPLMLDVLSERLSFLARHRHSGEIIATICACDLYLAHEKHPYDPLSAPVIIPLFDLLDEMNDSFIHHDFGQELKSNTVLQILMGATRAEHSSKGVGTRLRAAMCNHARDVRGFQYALAQTTNQATRHIYVHKMGAKELSIIDPTTWMWKKKGDGSYPYKDYNGGTIPNILINLKSLKNT